MNWKNNNSCCLARNGASAARISPACSWPSVNTMVTRASRRVPWPLTARFKRGESVYDLTKRLPTPCGEHRLDLAACHNVKRYRVGLVLGQISKRRDEFARTIKLSSVSKEA